MDAARVVASLKAYGTGRFNWGLVLGAGLVGLALLSPYLIERFRQHFGLIAADQQPSVTPADAIWQRAKGIWLGDRGPM